MQTLGTQGQLPDSTDPLLLHCAALWGRHSFTCSFIHALNTEGNLINWSYGLNCGWKVIKSWKATTFKAWGFKQGFLSQTWLTCPWWGECHSREPYSFSRKELPAMSIPLLFLWPSANLQSTSFPHLSLYGCYELEFNLPRACQKWSTERTWKGCKRAVIKPPHYLYFMQDFRPQRD